VVAPACRIAVQTTDGPRDGAFRRAWAAERLFWRWAPKSGRLGTLSLHLLTVAMECVFSFPRPRMLTQLAGRIFAGLQLSTHRGHWQPPETAGRQSPAPPHFLATPATRDRAPAVYPSPTGR
jgi:hypothetical protein